MASTFFSENHAEDFTQKISLENETHILQRGHVRPLHFSLRDRALASCLDGSVRSDSIFLVVGDGVQRLFSLQNHRFISTKSSFLV